MIGVVGLVLQEKIDIVPVKCGLGGFQPALVWLTYALLASFLALKSFTRVCVRCPALRQTR